MTATLFDLPHDPPPAAQGEPAWMRYYETRNGTPISLSQRAQPRRCRTCGRLVLHGLDHHRVAGEATIDPYQATPRDEAAAIILGLPTYWLAGSGPGKWEIEARYFPGVAFQPRSTADDILVAIAHHCGKPPLARKTLPTRPHHADTNHDGPIPF